MQVSKMTLFIVLFTLQTVTVQAAAEETKQPVFITLEEYVREYLEYSVNIKEKARELEKAEKDFRRAGEERIAFLALEKLEIAVGTARLNLAETESEETVAAVRRYFQYLQTQRARTTAEKALRLEEERLQVTSLHYESGLSTETELLEQKNVSLEAGEKLETAEEEYNQARRVFLRGIELEDGAVFLTEIDLTGRKEGKYDFLLCLQKARAVSSACYFAREILALNKKQWEAVQDPKCATEEERENAARQLEEAKENYHRVERELYDKIHGLLEEYESLHRRVDLAKRQAALAAREMEVAEIKFAQGEIRRLDLDQTQLLLSEAEDQVKMLREKLFVHELLLKTLTGENPVRFIAEAEGGSRIFINEY